MSQQTMLDDHHAQALTLAGTAGLVVERIVKRDIAIINNPEATLPAIVLWPGNAESRVDEFPVDAGPINAGRWAIIWQVYMPWDTTPDWQGRWEALANAVKAKVLTVRDFITASRPLAHDVRWGEEPPMWLRDSRAPNGMELFFTVTQEEF